MCEAVQIKISNQQGIQKFEVCSLLTFMGIQYTLIVLGKKNVYLEIVDAFGG